MDVFTRKKRSAIMSRIGPKNTGPETVLSQLLRRLGFRFRRHDKKLPGTPDFVIPRLKTTVFVNGCFWHGHNCKRVTAPQTNRHFWLKKIDGNRKRDLRTRRKLCAMGWHVLTIWQCRLANPKSIVNRLKRMEAFHA